MSKVTLVNKSGVKKDFKIGFSWTTLFFGGLVAMFRGQWSEFLKWVFLNPITLGIWGLVQCWSGNGKTIIEHLDRGYEPASERDRAKLVEKDIIA